MHVTKTNDNLDREIYTNKIYNQHDINTYYKKILITQLIFITQ